MTYKLLIDEVLMSWQS